MPSMLQNVIACLFLFPLLFVCGFGICIIGNPVFFFLPRMEHEVKNCICFTPSFGLSLIVQAKFCVLIIDFTCKSLSHLGWYLGTGVLHSGNQ